MRHLALLLAIGAAACGGKVGTVGQIGAPDDSGTATPIATGTPAADASPESGNTSTGMEDASTESTSDVGIAPAVGLCAGVPTVGLGGTIHGTTCGGHSVGEAICQRGYPDAFFYVGAPAGAALHLVVSSSSGNLALMGFPSCDIPNATECTVASAFDPDPGMRLFEVETVDQPCGDFTVTVTGQ